MFSMKSFFVYKETLQCLKQYLKGTVSQYFWPVFLLKRFDLGPYEQAKTVWLWLSSHRVSVINYYLDIMPAKSMTTQTLCQHSQQLSWHTWNYFTLKKEKNNKKINKKYILIFLKIACLRRRWLRRHCVCICSCWLHWHCVNVVIDYANTMLA